MSIFLKYHEKLSWRRISVNGEVVFEECNREVERDGVVEPLLVENKYAGLNEVVEKFGQIRFPATHPLLLREDSK